MQRDAIDKIPLFHRATRENSGTMRAENLEHGHENLLPKWTEWTVENGGVALDGGKVMGQGSAIVRA